ncbi:MAG: hypothetical protein QXO51_07380 [Halobacteria archaeon]
MIPEEIVVAVRRMEKRLLEIEIGNQASLRRLEQKIEGMAGEVAALKTEAAAIKAEAAAAKRAAELPSMVKTPAYPDRIPSLIPAQVPKVYRQKTKEGEFIIA